ncbi:MAG: hypothetical protein AB7G23_02765 [Vicinamibacterales bacterium]
MRERSTRLAACLLPSLVTAAWLLSPAPARAQAPTASQLADAAGAFVADFVTRFSNVVAEEQQEQRIPVERRTRRLRSDLLLVQVGDGGEFAAFRDVFEVDGDPVRERDERLMRLFVNPAADAGRRAQDIANEGTRHNFPGMGTLSNPLLALALMQDRYRERFRLSLGRVDTKVGPSARVLSYAEFVRPTLLRGNGNRDMPARVVAWVDETTGAVLRTSLEVGGFGGLSGTGSRVETTFAFDEQFGLNVPTEMQESHRSGAYEVTGVSTYGRFRRFTVTTDETLK